MPWFLTCEVCGGDATVFDVLITGSVESVLRTLTTSRVRKLGEDSCPNFMVGCFRWLKVCFVTEAGWEVVETDPFVGVVDSIFPSMFLGLGSDSKGTIHSEDLYTTGVTNLKAQFYE